MTNKDKINSKIEDLEAELKKLKKLANEPEQRTPQVGDVIERCGWTLLVDDNGGTTCLVSTSPESHPVGGNRGEYEYLSSSTYLGKFDEVYVKISDVREALGIEDGFSDSKTSWLSGWHQPSILEMKDISEALRKLNIIKD